MARGNRLAQEKSPYLRQHAHDPVDWQPWGEEAFERARREDKPVFLSIGYSACHWCHVMAGESFADEETAGLINGGFVAVKVDREERPDLDRHYMDVCQSMIGTAGWPLTILMTPDKRPFYAGTYIPKSRRWGRPGLTEILPRISEIWRTRRGEIAAAADSVDAAAGGGAAAGPGRRADRLSVALLHEAFRELSAEFDRSRGGFGGAPRFPIAHPIAFLLRYWQRTGNGEALGMAGKTLKAMRRGGIYDHLGYGFHRYATDAGWLVPHFEKMLPDQALLAEVYAEAFAATGRREFLRTAAEVAEYVLRDLAASGGGFFTSEDADSEGEEGRFYLWTRDELERVLGPEDAEFAALAFRVEDQGDADEGLWDGRSVLHEGRVPDEGVPDPLKAGPPVGRRLEGIRRKLLEARGRRPRPFKDTKILADWNGLMIAALAAVFRITGEDRYLRAAAAAADFVLNRMRGTGGRLWHAFMEGEALVPAFLDDHAFLIKGLTALYEAGSEPRFLEAALELMDRAVGLFWDAAAGGFFFTAEGGELTRRKEIADGALPSGNSVMFRDLVRLARLTGRRDFDDLAARLAAAFASEVASRPRLYTEFLCGLDHALGPAWEVVVAGRSDAAETRDLLGVLRRGFFRNMALLFKPADDAERAGEVERLAPFTRGLDAGGGPAAAYVCSGGACLRPARSPRELLEILKPAPPPISG